MSDGLNKWVARIFVGMGETVRSSLYLGLDSESDNLDRAAYYSFCEPLKHHFNIDDKEEN